MTATEAMGEHADNSATGAALREHTFDGIREFDNRLPNWWLWTFYLACIFSLLYWWHFHIVGIGDLPRESFRAEMEAAEARMLAEMANHEITDESLLELAAEPGIVAKGREIFVANCATCHQADGRGNIGPNLTDRYWLHGARPTQIYETITKGVEGKAMVAWLPQLGPARCQQVTAFVLSIKNTEVPGGKAPEGKMVE